MLRRLFDSAGEFNSAAWVWLNRWPGWVTLLVLLVSAAVLALAWFNVRSLSPRQRALLLGLRGLAVAVLVVVFLQPGVRLEHVSRVRNHVAVLIDASRSMHLPGESGSRLEDVQAMLARESAEIEAWQRDHQVDWFAFSDRAQPVADPQRIEPVGDATHLISALEDIATRFRPEELAAVVIVSDGADNGSLSAPYEVLPAAASGVVERLRVPIHTLFTGPKTPLPDIAIAHVAYDEFAFVRNAVSIHATITVRGYQDLRLPVTLRRGDTVLGTRTLYTREGESQYDFEFEFVPDKIGKDVFTLEVGAGPDEVILSNNHHAFVIRIIRDKIRVLQVVGRPSWDVQFVRNLLKKNPNVDLISFFILRTSASIDVASRDELSLIPFPTQELFEEQLGSFDLILFQNFTYRGYHMSHYLPLIRDYVREGGGFIMTGGDLSFTAGGYAGTAIEEFLPVRLPAGGADSLWLERFRPQLSEAGLRHPITALSFDPEENRKIWAELPPWSGANQVLGAAPNATVLAVHPTREAGGRPAPVVATREYGEGRVLAITTDSVWNWAFEAVGEGGDSRHFHKLWGNAIRWLIRDPALNLLRVEADRDRYPVGAQAQLSAWLVGADYQPIEGADVTLALHRVPLDASADSPPQPVAVQVGPTQESGERSLQVRLDEPGVYTVRAQAEGSAGPLSDEDVFVVAPDPLELRETAARPDTLRLLSQASGGQARELRQGLAKLERAQPAVEKVNRRRDLPLWSSPWLLALALLLPSAEWFLRRRWGLM